MLRIAISLPNDDLKHIQTLQKRLGIRSRSEFFRELVKRYEELEHQMKALSRTLEGYMKYPDATGPEAGLLLRDALQHELDEEWK